MKRVLHLIAILLIIISPFFLTSEVSAQSCACSPTTKTCSIDCGEFVGVECTPATTYICQGIAKTEEQCKLLPNKTWIATLRVCADFSTFINLAIQWSIILGALLAAVRFLVGGIQFITSSGDPKNVENARETMTYAVFGLVIITIAWLVMKTLGEATAPTNWRIWFGM